MGHVVHDLGVNAHTDWSRVHMYLQGPEEILWLVIIPQQVRRGHIIWHVRLCNHNLQVDVTLINYLNE